EIIRDKLETSLQCRLDWLRSTSPLSWDQFLSQMRQMTSSGMSEVTNKMQLRDLLQSSGQNLRAWVTAVIQAYHSLHGMNPSSEYARKVINAAVCHNIS